MAGPCLQSFLAHVGCSLAVGTHQGRFKLAEILGHNSSWRLSPEIGDTVCMSSCQAYKQCGQHRWPRHQRGKVPWRIHMSCSI